MRSPQAVGLLAAAGMLASAANAGCSRASTAQDVEHGAELYRVHGCAVCHGESGRGDGPAGAALARRPLDFRDAAALRRGSTIEAIARSIESGTLDGTAGMPAFAHIPKRDRERLAAFITSLREGTP